MLSRIINSSVLFLFLCIAPVYAVNFSGNGYDTGKFMAKDVTVDTSTFSHNLSALDSNLQHALNTIDALSSGGGGIQPDGSTTTTASIPFAQGLSIGVAKTVYFGGTSAGTAVGEIYDSGTALNFTGLISTSVSGTGVSQIFTAGNGLNTTGGAGGFNTFIGGTGDNNGDLIGANGFTRTGTTVSGFNPSNNVAGIFIAGNSISDFAVGNDLYVYNNATVRAGGIGVFNKLATTGYSFLSTGDSAQIIGFDRATSGNGATDTIQSSWAQAGASNASAGPFHLACGSDTGNGACSVFIDPSGGGGSGTSDRAAATVATFNFDSIGFDKQNNFTASGALTSSSNHIAWDVSGAQVASHTATENTTLDNPTNIKNHGTYILVWTQHASSPKTLAFGNKYKWASGVAPTVTAANGAIDIFTFVSDGTNMYGTSVLNLQ